MADGVLVVPALRSASAVQTLHDVALMLDREQAGRPASPTAGVIDSQTVKAPSAGRAVAEAIRLPAPEIRVLASKQAPRPTLI